MAAFSGGGGFAARGEPQAKYRRFFKAHGELFDGWQQTAPAAMLYAYWGGNPFSHVRPYGQPTMHDWLGRTHRPFVALVDGNLCEAASEMAGLRVIYLPSVGYEMSAAQLQAVLDWVTQGGWLVLGNERISLNGKPASELFGIDQQHAARARGRGKVVLWDGSDPAATTPMVAPTGGLVRNLRFAIYGQGDRLAVHVVNYNVCLLDEARQVLDVGPTPVELPIPAGWTAAKAVCYDPDAEPQPIACDVDGGRARFLLPETHVYQIVLLERID
jgi:hypothetical protein